MIQRFVGIFAGLAALLLSFPIYTRSITGFLLVTVFGWTSDNPDQSLVEAVFVRIINVAFLLSNLALTFAGVQIIRRSYGQLSTWICLLVGLWSAGVFYHWLPSP